jgi:hypothetical protein
MAFKSNLEKVKLIQEEKMFDEQKCNSQDVTAVITAMTDSEQPFLYQTVNAVIADSCIGQIILCVEERNTG